MVGVRKAWQSSKKKMIMAKKSSKIGVGSVIEDFTLISYDEDTGKMLILKNLGNGSKWLEPVAISIPDLFYLFKVEGVDPAEMIDQTRFEFHKAKVEVGCITQAPFDDDFNGCSDSYYYQVKVIRP